MNNELSRDFSRSTKVGLSDCDIVLIWLQGNIHKLDTIILPKEICDFFEGSGDVVMADGETAYKIGGRWVKVKIKNNADTIQKSVS